MYNYLCNNVFYDLIQIFPNLCPKKWINETYDINIYHNIHLPLMSKEILSICLLENEHNLLVHN